MHTHARHGTWQGFLLSKIKIALERLTTKLIILQVGRLGFGFVARALLCIVPGLIPTPRTHRRRHKPQQEHERVGGVAMKIHRAPGTGPS